MTLSRKQRTVLLGMAGGAIVAAAVVWFGARWNPFSFAADLPIARRLSIALQSGILVAFWLFVAIARLAKHRFTTPEDIDGGGLLAGSERAVLLQAILQNTLEQSLLAILVYAAWAVVMPATWLSVVPLAAIAFALGRLLFFVGYTRGAGGRSLGFAMTFYPSVALLGCIIVTKISWLLRAA